MKGKHMLMWGTEGEDLFMINTRKSMTDLGVALKQLRRLAWMILALTLLMGFLDGRP